KRYDDALMACDHILAVDRKDRLALICRGNALFGLRRFADALASFDDALAIDPNDVMAHDAVVGVALAACDWGRVERLSAALFNRKDAELPVVPFQLLLLCDNPELHLNCARNFHANLFRSRSSGTHVRSRLPHGRIRIGYLSSDFREHAVSHLVAALIERHDRARFEVVGISFGADDGSTMRHRLVAAFD